MSKNRIRIATRGSKLALYQAEKVKSDILLVAPHVDVELIVLKTKGDKILDTALSKIGDKGLFTKEIENALIGYEADIAVHSLKDLSTEMPDELQLSAVLKRGEYRDALVHKQGKDLSELDDTDVIATSSLRRVANLKKIYPDINIIDIRGNVKTRLDKMNNGHCDGLIMAAAGLQRLGFEEYISELIEPETMIPAVGQGAIAIQSRINDSETKLLLDKINHPETMQVVQAERKFLNTIEGGCQVPVGCYSVVDGEKYTIKGFVSNLDASVYIIEEASGSISEAINVGEQLADKLIIRGGTTILETIRNNS